MDSDSQIHNLWSEIISKYNTNEILNSKEQDYADIGIIFKQKPERTVFDKFNFARFNFKGINSIRPMYDDNINLLKYAFDDLGIEYSESYNELKHNFNNILFLPYSNPKLNNLAFDYTCILFQMEQLAVHKRDSSYIRLIQNSRQIWDYSQENIKYLKSINIENVSLLRFGYHPKMEVLNFNKKKDIDILFYGSMSERRRNILVKLKNMGYKVKVLWNIYGHERNHFIERSKVILNIKSLEISLLEEHRLSFLLNNSCFFISESPNFNENTNYNNDFIFCDYNKIVETCEFYLNPENEHLRLLIAKKGYETFSKVKMTDNLKKVISNLKQ